MLNKTQIPDNESVIESAFFESYEIKKYESKTIIVEEGGELAIPTVFYLRAIAQKLDVSTKNCNNYELATRQLGCVLIRLLNNDHK
ncbi:MAG: hypothetical protein GY804_00160 [Alphaproteobacteria bacterium]|nr:hypothetical protein [Alphaproteobacteria bacterium]